MTHRYTIIDADTGAALDHADFLADATAKARNLHRPDRVVAIHDALDIRGTGEGGHLVYETTDAGGRWL